MATTFGFASTADEGQMGDSNAMERIMQLKRIQRRSGSVLPPTMGPAVRLCVCAQVARGPAGDGLRARLTATYGSGTLERLPMGQRLPMGPQGPASGTLDAPLTQNTAPSTAAPSTGKSDMIRALRDTVRYLRSASTDPSAFVDPRSYHGDGSEAADVMEEMLTEMEALKSRDAASATVLRMAKENLEQRKEQISQLQAELASRAQTEGSTKAELAEQLRQKENELHVAYSQELAGQGRIQQLQAQVDGLQADLDTRREQDAHMKKMLNELEAQRGLHLEELERMRRETQRLLAQKGEEMDRVLQEAAQEVEAVRAAMNRQAQADPAQRTNMSPPRSAPTSAQGPLSNVPPSSPPKSREASRRGSVVAPAGGDENAEASLEVDRLKEALADVSTDLKVSLPSLSRALALSLSLSLTSRRIYRSASRS
jgi:hypothetical protein